MSMRAPHRRLATFALHLGVEVQGQRPALDLAERGVHERIAGHQADARHDDRERLGRRQLGAAVRGEEVLVPVVGVARVAGQLEEVGHLAQHLDAERVHDLLAVEQPPHHQEPAVEDVLLGDLHQRAAQRGLVEHALVDQDAIERLEHGAGAHLGRRAVVEVDRVHHAAGEREDGRPREPLIEHVDQQMDERRLLQRPLGRGRPLGPIVGHLGLGSRGGHRRGAERSRDGGGDRDRG